MFDDTTSVQIVDYTTTIQEYLDTTIYTMILDGTVEDQWEEFQEGLSARGADDLQSIYQNACNNSFGNLVANA